MKIVFLPRKLHVMFDKYCAEIYFQRFGDNQMNFKMAKADETVQLVFCLRKTSNSAIEKHRCVCLRKQASKQQKKRLEKIKRKRNYIFCL